MEKSIPKQIGFRPTPVDNALIDGLMSTGKFKTNTDLLRAAINELALSELGMDFITDVMIQNMFSTGSDTNEI